MPPHPLTNFEIQKCYQNESEFNGVHSRNNWVKTSTTMVDRRRKIEEKQSIVKMLDENINNSRSHIWSTFLKNISLGVQLYKNKYY